MVIDSHNHIYPDKVALVVQKMMETRGGEPLHGLLTASALRQNMIENRVKAGVIFCIAEKASVVHAANDFLFEVCDGKRWTGLGTIHPDYEDYKGEIERLKRHNLRGIKVHSYFQSCPPDDPRMMRIYDALPDGWIVYFHAGALGKEAPPANLVPSSPQAIGRVVDKFPKLRIVAAHFGGLHMLEDAKKYLLGRNIFIDTSWTPDVRLMDSKVSAKIIMEHGPNKVLFGSDYPFGDVKKSLDWFRDLPLEEKYKKQILSENASKLFFE